MTSPRQGWDLAVAVVMHSPPPLFEILVRSRGADYGSVQFCSAQFTSVRDLRNVSGVNVSVKWIHW